MLGFRTLSHTVDHVIAFDMPLLRRMLRLTGLRIKEDGYADPSSASFLGRLLHAVIPRLSHFIWVIAEKT